MACNVVWTQRAGEDLREIIGYIAKTLASPQAAAQHLDAFEEAVERVSRMPELYAVSAQPSLSARNLRPCFVGNYVMLYNYDVTQNVDCEPGGTVTIYRIFSTLQDYAKLIR